METAMMQKTITKPSATKLIAGSGSGSKGGSESNDTLESTSYMGVLDMLGEGQIGGLVDNSPKSIFLNDTPLVNESGGYNFKDVTWGFVDGTQTQDTLGEGFDDIEASFSVGVSIPTETPHTFTVTDPNADRVRVVMAVPQLIHTDSKGNTKGSAVEYKFSVSHNNGAFSDIGTGKISGKTRSRYQREYLYDLEKTNADGTPITRWTFKVTRITKNSSDSSTSNELYIDNYSVITTTKLSYPNTAMVGLQFGAEQFTSLPSRAYLVDGLLIKVPSNYDPISREYNGDWDGTFKLGVSSNPAWILYDLITNERYGLGGFIDQAYSNPARLYTIGRYCDQMVDDGFGSQEPRFSINTCINNRFDAYQLISDISSVFNGMTYWTGGMMGYMCDMPTPVSMIYSASNVIDGMFNYSSASRKDIHSVALVTYNDPEKNYENAVEYIEDSELVSRIGIRKAEITAFGCSSRGQANRVGKWLLYTERFQSKMISFNVGIDSALVLPGDVIQINDADRAGKRHGGRIVESGLTFAALDSGVEFEEGSTISIRVQDGTVVERAIESIETSNDKSWVTWVTPLEVEPVKNAAWTIKTPSLDLLTARVVAVGQGENPGEFSITAVEHNETKFDHIEYDLVLETPKVTVQSASSVKATSSVTIVGEGVVDQGLTRYGMSIQWEQVPNAVSYEVQFRKGDGNWFLLPSTKGLSLDVENVSQGEYVAKVVAISATGARSPESISNATVIEGQVTQLPKLGYLKAASAQFAINLTWEYGAYTSGVAYTEVEMLTDGSTEYKLLGSYAHPTKSFQLTDLMLDDERTFRARVVDAYGFTSEWSETVTAKPNASAEMVLELIKEQVGLDLLDAETRANVEAVKTLEDALSTTKTTVEELALDVQENEDLITSEIDDRAKAITALSKDTAKKVSDLATQTATNLDAEAAKLSAQISANTASLADETTARVNAIKAEQTARTKEVTDKVKALETSVKTTTDSISNGVTKLESTLTAKDAEITKSLNAYKVSNGNAITALTESVETVTTDHSATVETVKGLTTKVDKNASDILEATKSATTQTDALAEKISALTTTVNTNDSEIKAQVLKAETAISTLDTSTATKFDGVAASIKKLDESSNTLSEAISEAKAVADSAVTTNTAQATDIKTLKSRVTTTETNIKKKADVTVVDGITTRVSNAETELSSQAEKVSSLETAITDVDTKAGTAVSNAAKAQSTANSAVTANTALGERVDKLQASLTDLGEGVDTAVDTTAFNVLKAEVKDQGGKITALAESTTQLGSDLATVTDSVSKKADTTALNSLKTTVTNNGKTLTTAVNDVSALKTRASTIEKGLATKVEAETLSDYYTKTDADTAIAGKLDTFNASLQIGGVNLLPKTNWQKRADVGTDAQCIWGTPNSSSYFKTNGLTGGIRIDAKETTANVVLGYQTPTENRTAKVIAGRTYTLSFVGQGTFNSLNYCYLLGGGASGANLIIGAIPFGSGGNTRRSVTFKATTTSEVCGVLIGANRIWKSTDWFSISELQLEEGTKATVWSQSTDDIQSGLDANASAITKTNAEVVKVDGKVTTNASNITKLTTRVTDAEGTLKKKADATALSDYYTKTQADTATAGKIDDFNASLFIGGANLILNGNVPTTSIEDSGSNKRNNFYYLSKPFDVIYTEVVKDFGGKVTVSFDWAWIGTADQVPAGKARFQVEGGKYTSLSEHIEVSADNTSGHMTFTLTVPANWLDYPGLAKFGARRDNFVGKLQINNMKLEYGSKATAWTPSDADVNTALEANTKAIDSVDVKVEKVGETVASQGTLITGLRSDLTKTGTTADNALKNAATAQTTANTGVTNAKAASDKVTALTTTVANDKKEVKGLITTVESSVTDLEKTVNAKIDTVKSSFDAVVTSVTLSGSMDIDNDIFIASGNSGLQKTADATALGGFVLNVGDNVGTDSDTVWACARQSMIYDPNRLYRVRARMRRVAGTGGLYMGVSALTADKSSYVTTSDVLTPVLTSSYYAASGKTPTLGEWVEYEGYFKGRAATGGSSGDYTYEKPKKLSSKACHITPMFIANYSGKPGISEIDYVILEVADDLEGLNSLTAEIKKSYYTKTDADKAIATAKSAVQTSVNNSIAKQGETINTWVEENKVHAAQMETIAAELVPHMAGNTELFADIEIKTGYQGVITALADADASLLKKVESLSSKYDDAVAKLSTLESAYATANASIAQSKKDLTASFTAADTTVSNAYKTADTNVTNAYKTADTAAIKTATANAKTAMDTALKSYTTTAKLTTDYITKADATTAISSATTTLKSQVQEAINNASPNENLIRYDLLTRGYFNGSSPWAVGGTGTLNKDVYDPTYYPCTAGTVISTTIYEASESHGGTGRIVWYDSSKTAIGGSNTHSATLTTLKVTAPANTAFYRYCLISRDSKIKMELGSTVTPYSTSTVELRENASVINGVTAMKTVVVDNNGVLSGYGLVSEVKDGKVTSAFGVNADTFYVGSPSTGKKVFTVSGTTAILNDAIIGNLSASKITTGTLGADRIAAGSIKATKLHADVIKAVAVEARSFTSTGTDGAKTVQSGGLTTVYDSAGVMRVRLGIW